MRITVQDQGKGIAADKIHKLFMPFERLGAETSEVEGAGIGLSIAKQLTQDMDGILEFETVENEGSVFYVEFDCCPTPEESVADREGAEDFGFKLNLAQQQNIDLVLLDIMMPKMSGYETYKRILAHYQAHELPIIFLTARSQTNDLVLGFEAGAND